MMFMTKRNSIPPMLEEIAGLRRQLHENPGLAYEEDFASDLVAQKLTEWGITFTRGMAKTGIVATIEGREPGTKSVGLRADMDALPIEEKTERKWASKVPGKMHACGHDGHTAILLGTAKYLNETRNFAGKVHLIFQPAEEGGRGANVMIDEGLFDRFPVDAVYALHNWPGVPLGKAIVRPGPIMAGVDDIKVTIKGKGGHAAYPHKCIDPTTAICAMVTALQNIVARNVSPLDSAVISVTNVHSGGGAFNVIPEEAWLSGTIRTFKRDVRDMVHARIKDTVSHLAAAYGVQAEVQLSELIDPTTNDAAQTEFAIGALQRVLGVENVDPNCEPTMGGEDFGAMLELKPGCYVKLGQGVKMVDSAHNQGLHTPRYDFNDDLIPIAMDYFAEIVESALPVPANK